MLSDLLAVLRNVRRIHRVIVVSADPSVRCIVKPFGAGFLWEGKRRGLNKGVRLAIQKSKRRGAAVVLVIHADIPLVTTREIRRFLRDSRNDSVALTPSKDGYGTNALLLRPPEVIRPAFGKDSFRRHLSLARQKGLSRKVVRSKAIAFDVDRPSDLRRLLRYSLSNETGRFLRTMRQGVSTPTRAHIASVGT
jgi:2-phospho-L-lactate guanylyltransferase